jgi:hypothetical protein
MVSPKWVVRYPGEYELMAGLGGYSFQGES